MKMMLKRYFGFNVCGVCVCVCMYVCVCVREREREVGTRIEMGDQLEN